MRIKGRKMWVQLLITGTKDVLYETIGFISKSRMNPSNIYAKIGDEYFFISKAALEHVIHGRRKAHASIYKRVNQPAEKGEIA